MGKTSSYRVPMRRKREAKTDYRRRLKLLLSGKHRLVVRTSLNHTVAQFAKYSQRGDEVVASVHSNELKKYGWRGGMSNISAGYLVGLLCGLKARAQGIKEAVLDIGRVAPVKGSRIFAVFKGAIDSGVSIPHSSEVFPADSRIRGEHISAYAGIVKGKSKTIFSKYFRRKLDPVKLPKHFEDTKKNILESFKKKRE
ncbi:MAG: 50S ribosomal protein L18 [Candidatus Hydrothermarchaeaceae archaeon]